MRVSRERFESGLTYDEYKSRMAQHGERLERNERRVAIYASDLVALKSLPEPLHVLAAVGDATDSALDCSSNDIADYLSALGRAASDSGMLNVRVFSGEARADLPGLYPQDGGTRPTAVFVFLDSAFGEVGRFVGQSDASTGDPAEEERLAAIVREVVAIVKQHLARLRSTRRLAPPPTSRPKRPVKVTITYCAACGYEPQTLELVQALMLGPRFDLSSIEIVVGEEGAFEVVVDGELIHSMYRDGGFPENEKIVAAVKAHVMA